MSESVPSTNAVASRETGVTFDRSGTLAGHPVARVGFGSMSLAVRGERGPLDHDVAIAVVRRVIELGVNHIDTADFYGDGVSNAFIREALHPYADDLVLVSKVGAEHDTATGQLKPAQRPEQLRAAVESNLRHLGVDRLAVVNMRRADGGAGMNVSGDQVVDLDSQLAELMALRDEGKIEGIGLSNVSLDQLNQALPAGIVCVQNYYNLIQRSDEAMLAECSARGIAWVPFFPLGSSFDGFPKVTDQPAVVAAARDLDVTPAQVGLAWLLAHDPHVLLIPGTADIAHLEQNVAVGDIRLPAEVVASLDALAAEGAASGAEDGIAS